MRTACSLRVKNELLKSNIWRFLSDGTIVWSSRFIQMYMEKKIREANLPKLSLPTKKVNEKTTVDVPKLVKLVIKHMNRSAILSAQPKTNFTDQSMNAPSGPKEIVYVNQFNETMKKILGDFTIK